MAKKEKYKCSFFPNAIKIWNTSVFDYAEKFSSFKAKLCKYDKIPNIIIMVKEGLMCILQD